MRVYVDTSSRCRAKGLDVSGMARVGEYLRQTRDRRGWTQDEAAEESGFSSRIISDWENNIKVPGADSLLHYADVLGADIREVQRRYLGRKPKAAPLDDFEAEAQEILDAGDQEMLNDLLRPLRRFWLRYGPKTE